MLNKLTLVMFSVVPNLYMVETVDNQKLAQTLNNHWEKYRRPGKLNVMIQINTSLEESKLTSATFSEKPYMYLLHVNNKGTDKPALRHKLIISACA